jgi:DNA-binding MurR/RpiR family transcriptional regulator
VPTSRFFDLSHAALSPELLRAARWLEKNPGLAAMQSMRECARRSGFAPATFTRLAHALGHAGFDGLKQRFQQAIAPDAAYAIRARALQAKARRDAGWLETLNEAQHANAASACGLNTPAQFERAAQSMLQARTVHFLGLRASHGLAFHLHYSYRLLSPNGVLLQDLGGTMADELARMGKQDLLVAIALSPYTRQTVLAVEQAAGHGVPVLALTDSALSPLARVAGQSLLFRAQGSSYFQSMVGALALAEGLAAAVAARGGRKVLAHLQAMQSQLTAQGAYWEQIDPPAPPDAAPQASSRKSRTARTSRVSKTHQGSA